MESQISLGKEWLQQLLDLMGIAAEIETEGFEITSDSDSSWLNINGSSITSEQKQQLIGDKGGNIDAVQYLANTILNLDRDPEAQSSFVIELDSYRIERHRELTELTQQAIDKVRATGQEVEIPGLSSAERKEIHSLLQDDGDLATESRGQEPNRKLVVLPQSLTDN